MVPYIKQVKAALYQTVGLLAVSVSLLPVLAVSYWYGMSIELLRGIAAGAAIALILAAHRLKHLDSLLTPNTFVTSEFMEAVNKYRGYKRPLGWACVCLTIVGVVLGLLLWRGARVA